MEAAGNFSIRTVEHRVGRTSHACGSMLRRQHGGGGLSRGQFTLQGAEKETGYHRSQLSRARKALGQAWMRTSGSGRWLITVEQLEALTAWLATDYWCVRLRLTECVRHRGRDAPHLRNGLCMACFNAVRLAARQLGLRPNVRDLATAVTGATPLAAPPDRARLTDYAAQLGRGLMLLETDLHHLARIVELADLVRRRGGAPEISSAVPPAG